MDSGKSTLFGHLLVTQYRQDLRQEFSLATKLAAQNGKASFNYAYLMDTSAQERDRGVTVSVNTYHTILSEQEFVLQDCPGHRDFIDSIFRNIIAPDAGIIIVDPTNYHKMMTEFAENAQLLMVFGVRHFIIIVNKMDKLNYEKQQFETIVGVCKSTLKKQQISKKLGFKIQFIPTSAIDEVDNNIAAYSDRMPFAESTLLLALGGVKRREISSSMTVNCLLIDCSVLDSSYVLCRVYVQSGVVNEMDVLFSLPSFLALTVFGIFNVDMKEVNRAAAGG